MTFNVKVLTSLQGNSIIIDAGDGFMTTINPSTIVEGVADVRQVVRLDGARAGQPLRVLMKNDVSFTADRVATDMDYPFSELKALVIEYRSSTGAFIAHLFGWFKGELHHLKMPVRYNGRTRQDDVVTLKPIKNLAVSTRNNNAEASFETAKWGIKSLRFIVQFDPVYGDLLWRYQG